MKTKRLNELDVYVFEEASAVVQALADELQKLGELRQTAHIALSGGSTPISLFEFIAASNYRDSIAWEHLHFWWGDERCVPSFQSESNYGEADRRLFQKLVISAENIHPIVGELLPEEACTRFESDLSHYLPWVNGLPQFDWILLGIGEDGHTASLFPQQTDYQTSQSTVVAQHPQSGQNRVSLTAAAIENARRVTYLALGESKRAILPQVLGTNGQRNVDLPAARIRAREGLSECFIDQAAGAELGLN